MKRKHSAKKGSTALVSRPGSKSMGPMVSDLLGGIPHTHHGDHVHIPDFYVDRQLGPAVNIQETAKEYVLCAGLPGLDKKDLKVDVRDGVLTLSCRRQEKRESREPGYVRQEQFFGSFQRSFMLPENVKAAGIKATYKDGLLTVILPRAKESKKPGLKIAIN